MPRRLFLAAAVVALAAGPAPAAEPLKKLLLVTDSGGFVHDSVALAEEVMKEIGPKHGFEVTCYRFTRTPDPAVLAKYSADFRKKTGQTVGVEHCGVVDADTLKKFDAVLFFTTGRPLNNEQVLQLSEWVKAGGALAGVHCATDTLYPAKDAPANALYGEMMGGYFDGHPWHQKVTLKVEDPKHPAARGFESDKVITDEIYQFRPEPYSRAKLRVILSIDNSSVDVSKPGVKRADKDFAVAWVREYGKGKCFYTSLGHRKEVWNDPRFQEHLFGGLNWAVGRLPGDATPSAPAAGN